MEKKCLREKDGLWVLFNGSEYVVGLTAKSQGELGKVTFASLPKPGQAFEAGQAMVELEAEKAVQEFPAPVKGTISSINEDINKNIEILNDEDEMTAWLVSFKDVDVAEFDKL